MEIKNQFLKAKFKLHGAELVSLINTDRNLEMLWQGDEAWWGKSSPILFPFIGMNLDNEFQINNQVYSSIKHGFLRDQDFELLSLQEDEIWFSFKSNKETEKDYPFKFEVLIGYVLEWNKLHVRWVVKNLGENPMYYMIGGHPAFNADLNDTISFVPQGKTKRYIFEGAYVGEIVEEQAAPLSLQAPLFYNDAVIYDNIESVSLLRYKNASSVKVTCSDFSVVGIWSMIKNKEMAPFVCIEPWLGLPDTIGEKVELTQRKFVQSVEGLQENNHEYTIEIG